MIIEIQRRQHVTSYDVEYYPDGTLHIIFSPHRDLVIDNERATNTLNILWSRVNNKSIFAGCEVRQLSEILLCDRFASIVKDQRSLKLVDILEEMNQRQALCGNNTSEYRPNARHLYTFVSALMPDIVIPYEVWKKALPQSVQISLEEMLTELLTQLQNAWGDLEALSSLYSETAVWITGTSVIHGRGNIEKKYVAEYPLGSNIGKLELRALEGCAIMGVPEGGEQIVSAMITWALIHGSQRTASGYAMLTCKRINGRFQILQEMTL